MGKPKTRKAALAGLLALGLGEISAATPAAAQAINTFTGPYIGAHTGYFSGDATFSNPPYSFMDAGDTFNIPGRSQSFDIDGLLAGVHGGINFAFGPSLVGGLEGDWSWLNESDRSTFSGSSAGGGDGFTFQSRSKLDFEWQGTLRGRLGVVAGNTYIFGTAGVAFLNVDWSETTSLVEPGGTNGTLTHSDSDTLVGGAVGGGVEIAISPIMILGADYLYEDFETFNSVPNGFFVTQSGKIDDIDVHKVRVRVSIKLGGAPPQ